MVNLSVHTIEVLQLVNTFMIIGVIFGIAIFIFFMYTSRMSKQEKMKELLRSRINARWPYLNNWFEVQNHIIFYGNMPSVSEMVGSLRGIPTDDGICAIIRRAAASKIMSTPERYVDKFLIVQYNESNPHNIELQSVSELYPDLRIIERENGALRFNPIDNIPLLTDEERKMYA